MEQIYDVIAWGRVVVQGKEFYLLAPKPYHSEMDDNKVGHQVWQLEGTYKWEVADTDYFDGLGDDAVYSRSIIIFGQDALIEFYQDPQAIKVKYIIPESDDENQI